MSRIDEINAMDDFELRAKAEETYRSVKNPSANLKNLYEIWMGPNRLNKIHPHRMHYETIYKLSLFERDALGEEVWNNGKK